MDYLTTDGSAGIGWLWIAVHLLGLLTAWMVRMHSGKRLQIVMQGGYYTLLLVVSLTTVVGQLCCLQMWPLSGLTLALMIVVAIIDLGVSEQSAIGVER